MNDNTIVKISILIYDLALLAGTAYLVTIHNWSMWAFLLAAVFFMTSKNNNETKSNDTTGSN